MQLDMLQEENEIMHDKVCSQSNMYIITTTWGEVFSNNVGIFIQLRHAEEKRKEAEARTRELEKQVPVPHFSSCLIKLF